MSKKNYKYLLFDWDGCLAKTLDVWMVGYKTTFPLYGLNPTEEEIVEKCYGQWDGPKNFGITDFVDFYKKLMPVIEPHLETVDLYPHVKETLNALKKAGKKMSVASTSERRYVEKALRHNGLEIFFETTVFGDETAKHKPDPEPIFKSMEKLNAKGNQSIIIGDSDKDILAARNAGIDSVLFFPKENDRFYKKATFLKLQPTYVIHQFDELLEII